MNGSSLNRIAVKMKALIVLVSVLVSCNAGFQSIRTSNYDDGGDGGVYGVGFEVRAGVGGQVQRGGVGGGQGLGGGVGGQVLRGGVREGQVLGGGRVGVGSVGGVGEYFSPGTKYGTCPRPDESNFLQMGSTCNSDWICHGSQKCCSNSLYGRRCQIPIEFQKPGRCNSFLMMRPLTSLTYTCNDDTLCPGSWKCCRRFSSGQLDTCTFNSEISAGFGDVDGSYGPVGGSNGPIGGSGVVSPLRPVYPRGTSRKRY